MDPKSIVREALNKTSRDARTAYLDSQCGCGTPLRAEVESLLNHDEQTGGDVPRPADESNTRRLGPAAAGPAPAPTPSPADTHAPGTMLGTYRVIEILGKGGMGVVYLAEDLRLRRRVAVKAMLVSTAADTDLRQRFVREARAVAIIENDHVVPIYQVGEEDGIPFLVMPFLKGATLDRWLAEHREVCLTEILRLGRDIARGLAATHEQGLIHRDIKPANIWIEPDGRAKILDFGLARTAEDKGQLTSTGFIVGTPAYMAPEQARDEALDHRCDLFSLGSVLYRLCTGKPPFGGESTMAMLTALAVDSPQPIAPLNPGIPSELETLVMQLLAKDPAARPPSAQEVVQRLRDIERMPPESPRPVPDRVTSDSSNALALASSVSADSNTARQASPALAPQAATGRRPVLIGIGVLAALLLGGAAIFIKSSARPLPIAEPKPPPDLKPRNLEVVQILPRTYTNEIGMPFVLVPKGTAWLRGAGGTPGTWKFEIARDFYLGTYEVTQGEWQKVMGDNPSAFSRSGTMRNKVKDIPDAELARLPVENITWDDAQQFLTRLNEQNTTPGWVYRLPTVDQWEYACREGPLGTQAESGSDYYFDKPTNKVLPTQANFQHVAQRTCKVGSFAPNRLGLFDMHGNVEEWCADEGICFDRKSIGRTFMGGDWNDSPWYIRASKVEALQPGKKLNSIGIRVARMPAENAGPGDVAALLTSGDYQWAPPENLGNGVNGPGRDLNPTLTDDECTLVFARGNRLFLSRRGNRDAAFAAADPLPDTINQAVDEAASISGDGLLLFFSRRGGGPGFENIWMSTRATPDEPFGTPICLPKPVNSAAWERAPCLTADGLTLLVTSSRQRPTGDIHMFTRTHRKDDFAQETLLPAPINTPAFDVADWLSLDQRVLVRTMMPAPPDRREVRLFVRPTRDARFGPALPLGPPLDALVMGRPWLSPDGRRMYFHSRELPGGEGDLDLWMTRRVRKSR